MTVFELMELLENICDQGWGDCSVITYDADAECALPITGALFGGDAMSVQLYTDTDEEEET